MTARYSVPIAYLLFALAMGVLQEWNIASPPAISGPSITLQSSLHSSIRPIVCTAPTLQVARRGLPRRREGGGTRFVV